LGYWICMGIIDIIYSIYRIQKVQSVPILHWTWPRDCLYHHDMDSGAKTVKLSQRLCRESSPGFNWQVSLTEYNYTCCKDYHQIMFLSGRTKKLSCLKRRLATKINSDKSFHFYIHVHVSRFFGNMFFFFHKKCSLRVIKAACLHFHANFQEKFENVFKSKLLWSEQRK
jgi:hypothetical protein